MVVELYTNSSDDRKVSKSLTFIGEFECNIKDETSVHSPSIVLNNIGDNAIANCNYIYIPSWRRYYYVNNINVATGGRVIIDARVDVLMSYKSAIYSTTCLVTRQENIYNNFITDSRLQYRKGRIQTVKKLADINTSDRNYYITTVGTKEV